MSRLVPGPANRVRSGDVIETNRWRVGLGAALRGDCASRPLPLARAAQLLALAWLTDGPPETTVESDGEGRIIEKHQATFRREWHERNFALHTHQLGKGSLVVEVDAFTQALAFRVQACSQGKVSSGARHRAGFCETMVAEMLPQWLSLPPLSARGTGLGQFTDRQGNVALALETRCDVSYGLRPA